MAQQQRRRIDASRAADSSVATTADSERRDFDSFFFVRPNRENFLSYVVALFKHGGKAHTACAPTDGTDEMDYSNTSWQQRIAVGAIHVLLLLQKPVAFVGRVIELTGNTFVANDGFFKTLYRLPLSALSLFRKGPLIVPKEDTAAYRTTVGLLDPRDALLSTPAPASAQGEVAVANRIFPVADTGDKKILDLMIVAAKLVYENEALITSVVNHTWQMNLVDIYNCWNEYQQRWSKLVFIFTDKKEDADAVVVVWRGTEPFATQDWATDLDFSWFDLKDGVGRVHVGFFEALGLGVRTDLDTLKRMTQKRYRPVDHRSSGHSHPVPSPSTTGGASGLDGEVINDPEKILAYDNTTDVVKNLLEKNPRAKLYVTGHSLGGALTVLYGSMLHYFGESTVTARIGALYTFGQPRVGDTNFANYLLQKVGRGQMYRVVYCNDIVPRVPFDDRLFQYRHYGMCFYFKRDFSEQTLKDAPNKNFFDIKDFLDVHWNALCELVESISRHNKYGRDYKESTASVVFRIIGLFLPGIASHSPVNYVNAVRLSKALPLVDELSSLELS